MKAHQHLSNFFTREVRLQAEVGQRATVDKPCQEGL